MERLKRAAIISRLVTKLRESGSWCGETHIQKAVYLMQELLEVPTEYEFMHYKHAPYSFELSDELTSFRADQLLQLCPQSPPYGPRYEVTEFGHKLEKRWPKTLAKFGPQLKSVAEIIDSRSVGELERLATALLATRQKTGEHDGAIGSRAEYTTRLTPHVSVDEALDALQKIDSLIDRFQELNSE